MNSEERRAARRKRREEKRAAKKAERTKDCTFEAMVDLNALYKAAKEAAKGVRWKASVQRYHIHLLRNVYEMKTDLEAGREICKGFIKFNIYERGKLRKISSVHFSERVPQKSMAKTALVPAIIPTLVYDASANVKGKGVHFAQQRIKRQLADYYRTHGREGYILQVDFKDYFASIPHDRAKELVRKHVPDPRLVELHDHFIDVQGSVGLGLGSEPNQICAISFPTAIDHFVLECGGVEAYGRYMDDLYAIHPSKDHLQLVLGCIEQLCYLLGIKINYRKTHIVKLSHGFVFLKKKITLTETGRIYMKPCRDSITRERRRLKKMAKLVEAGEMTPEQMNRSYQSWRGSVLKLDARGTVMHMDALYRTLKKPAGGGRFKAQNIAA